MCRFLEKRNPYATRASVVRSSIGGATAGTGLLLFQWFVGRLPGAFMWSITPPFLIFCAFTAGVFEWQWPPDDPDKEGELSENKNEGDVQNKE